MIWEIIKKTKKKKGSQDNLLKKGTKILGRPMQVLVFQTKTNLKINKKKPQ